MSEHILLTQHGGSSRYWFGMLNLHFVRQSCVEACLEAMIEERRFQYTDMFVHK